MRLIKRRSQNRRDFWADYKCEFCGAIEADGRGYDDANFYNNVIPKMKCTQCGESTVSKKGKAEKIQPVVPEGMEI